MRAIEILKTELYEKFAVMARTLAPIEILDLEEVIGCEEHSLNNVINFPLPLREDPSETATHVAKAWAWEREGLLFVLVELPEEDQGPQMESLVPFLNSRVDITGRFYQSGNRRIYYLNVQSIVHNEQPREGHPYDLLEIKAARRIAQRLTGSTLAAVAKDLAVTLPLLKAVEGPIQGTAPIDDFELLAMEVNNLMGSLAGVLDALKEFNLPNPEYDPALQAVMMAEKARKEIERLRTELEAATSCSAVS